MSKSKLQRNRKRLVAEALEQRLLLTTALIGDFNADGQFSAADIDALTAQVRAGSADLRFDLTHDSLVNIADVNRLVGGIFGTLLGDVDLNGQVNIVDLAVVADNLGKPGPSSWAKGDVNGDGVVTQTDLDSLASQLGKVSEGGPALLNKAVALSRGLDSVSGALAGWLGNFNLTPAAGMASSLPVVNDTLATALQLATKSTGKVPQFPSPAGVSATLNTGLQGLGLSVIKTGLNGQPLEVRLTADVKNLAGSGALGGLTRTLLAGIDPSITLSGNLLYDADLKFNLVLGADDQGFYLSGDSRIDLDLGASGNISGSYSLPLGALGVTATGQADADFLIGLVSTTPGLKIRTVQLVGNPATLWAIDADGTAHTNLALTVTKGGQPTDVALGGSWTIPVVNGAIGQVVSNVTTPDPGNFVQLLISTLKDGMDQFLSPDVAALLQGVGLPLTTGAPGNALGSSHTAADEGFDSPLWFVNALNYVKSRLAVTGAGSQGAFYTEGDAILHADALRRATNASGAGITVGVISDGIRGLAAAQHSGDLPAVLVNKFLGEEGAEGTAMLEIIHDVAPGAKLLFSGFGRKDNFDSEKFNRAIDWLIANGANIIVDDFTFLTEPYYEDSAVGAHIRSIVEDPDNKVLFVSSAGNEGRNHLHQAFDLQETVLPGETAPRRLHRFSHDGDDVFSAAFDMVAGTATVGMSWSEPYATPSTSYRLLLIDPVTGKLLQTGEVLEDQAAAELTFDVNVPQTLALAIEQVGDSIPGQDPAEFSLYADDAMRPVDTGAPSIFGYIGETDDAIFGHPAVQEVLTVGEVHVTTPNERSAASSEGPSTMLLPDGTLLAIDSLDVMGVGGVNISGFGNFYSPFFGTSAAAPHVAAIAALLMQLFPDAGPRDIHDAIRNSATDLDIAGYDQFTGRGRVDAVNAASKLDERFDIVLPPSPAPLPAPPGGGGGLRGLNLLQARGFEVLHGLTSQQLGDLLAGKPISGDLLKLHFSLSPNDDFDPLRASFQFNPSGIGTIGQLGLNGFVDAELRPDVDLTFGLDANGFYLDPSSKLGGQVNGSAGLSGKFGPFDAGGSAKFSAHPMLAYSGLGNTKLRPGDLVSHLGNLTLSLGTVTADLQLDLALNFLDYIDIDSSRPNDPNGGDPFKFRANATLTAAQQQNGQFKFTWSNVGLANPNIDGKQYTLPILVDNLIRFGKEKLSGPGGLFGAGGILQQVLNQSKAPLTSNPLSDATGAGQVQPGFEKGNLGAITDIANWVSDHFHVDLLLDFDDIKGWLNNGLPPQGTDLARLRYDLGDISLTPLANLAEKLDGILPAGVQVGDILNMVNAKLSGSLVFGIDTASGVYLLPGTPPLPGGASAAPLPGGAGSQLQLAFDINADLSNQLLNSQVFSLQNVLAKISPVINIALGGLGKIYLGALPLNLSNLNINLGSAKLKLLQAAAKLFPRQANSPFKGSVQNLHGEMGLDGSFDLTGEVIKLDLDKALSLSADSAHFLFDPANPLATIATITNLRASLPNYPTFPQATISSLAIGAGKIDVRNLVIADTLGEIGTVLEAINPALTSSLTVNIAQTTTSIAGNLTLSASSVKLFPQNTAQGLTSTLTTVSGSVDLATGLITATVGDLQLEMGKLFKVGAQSIALTIDPNAAVGATILSLPTATLTTTALKTASGNPVSVILSNLALKNNGFSLGSASLPATDFVLGTIAQFDDLAVSLTNLSYTTTTGFNPGGLTITAAGIAILPNLSTPVFDGTATASGVTFDLNLNTGQFTSKATALSAKLGDLIQIDATSVGAQLIELNFTDDPASNVFSFPSITGTFPALKRGNLQPQVTLTGLALKRDGSWRLATVGLSVPAQYTFGIAELLPFAPTQMVITFAKDAQNNPNLNQFDLAMDGQFNIPRLKQILGFTPTIQVGQQTFSEQSNGAVHLDVAVSSLSQGRIGLKNFGPLKLGIQNWKIGEVVFDGQITLGQFDATGNLGKVPGSNNQIEGFIGFDFNNPDSKVKQLDASNLSEFGTQAPSNPGTSNIGIDGGGLSFVGSYVTNGTNTTLSFNFDGSLKLKFKLGDLLELYGVGFNFDFGLTNPNGQFNPAFNFNLNNLSVDGLRAAFGDQMVFTATPGQQGAPGLKINFKRAGANDPVVDIAHLGLHFPGLSSIGGSIDNLRILPGGAPDLPNTAIHIDFGTFFSPQNKVFDWLPIRVDSLGMKFKEAMFTRDTAGKIIGIADPLAFSILFSGGIDQGDLGGGFKFPLKATVTDEELDLVALRQGKFPFKNPKAVSIAIDPSSLLPNDSPFKIRGGLSFGSVQVNNKTSTYARLFGEFQISDGIGGGLDLVISDRGPLLAKVIVPLAVPLGPTGLVLTQASGNIAFGVSQLRSVLDPMELVTDPLFFDPFEVTDDKITSTLQKFITDNTFSWQQSFSVGLTGNITTIASPGILNGKVSLGLNIVMPQLGQPLPALRFLGTGNITLYGLPLGRAGLLLDLANPLAPKVDFAFAAPAPDNPLGFLLPARANFAVSLKTNGLVEAPLIGLRSFINTAANGFLDQIATTLRTDHTRPLAIVLLDSDGNGNLNSFENSQFIDAGFIKSRVLSLIPTSFSAIIPGSPLINQAIKLASAFYYEYSMAAGNIANVFTAIKQNDASALTALAAQGQQAFVGLSDLLLKSALQAGVDAWAGFNPSLVISGELQPLVFGFPLGEPDGKVDLIINKHQISFAMRGSLLKSIKAPINQITEGFSAPLLNLMTLGLEDRLGFGFTLNLPDQVIDGLLTGGKRVLNDNGSVLKEGVNLAALLLDAINPFANWEVLVEGDLLWLGVKLGSISGLLFGPQPFDATGKPNPGGLAGLKILDLDPDGDGTPNADRVKQSDNTPGLIPVSRHGHYVDMMKNGGALLTGQLFMPAILKDPVGVFNSINWTPPNIDGNAIAGNPLLIKDAFDRYKDWVSSIVSGLTADASYGRLQMYIPSPARLFDLDTFINRSYLQPYGSDQEADGTNEVLLPASAPGMTRAPSEPFQDRNGNSLFDGGDAFIDTNFNNRFDVGIDTLIELDGLPGASGDLFQDLDGNHQFFTGGFFRDLGNGVFDGPESSTDLDKDGVRDLAEPFNDTNGNGVLDATESFTDVNGDGVWNAAEAFTDLNGDGIAQSNELFLDLNGNHQRDSGEAFTDLGNGAYDPGEAFQDLNHNGLRDTNEPFTDAGNGIYDGPEAFTDSNKNGIHNSGEPFTDENENGLYDAGESYVDRGNGVYDGPAGAAKPRLALRSPATITQEIRDIFNTSYIEGLLDAQLFSIRFGKAFIHLTPLGLQAELTVPWLVGATVQATLGVRDLNFTDMLGSLMDSPLLGSILQGKGLSSANLKSILNNPSLPIPDIKIPYPVANLGAEISSAGFAAWLHDTFGVPTAVLRKSATSPNTNASFDLFTPGFGDPAQGATGSQIFGGARVQAKLDLPGFVDDANFVFDTELIPTSLSSFVLPNFVAQASIPNFSATAGLKSLPGILQLQGVNAGDSFRISLNKRSNSLTGALSGQVVLLPGSSAQAIFNAQGDFQANLDPLNNPGLFGDVILTAIGGGGDLGNLDYSLTGNFALQVNTTPSERTIVRGQSPNQQTIHILPGLRVHADGTLSIKGFNLAGGVFDLTVAANRLRLDMDANLNLLALGSYSIDNSFVQLDGSGLSGRITLTDQGVTDPFFDLDGTFALQANTTGAIVDAVPPGVKVTVTSASLQVFGFDFHLPDVDVSYDSASSRYSFSVSSVLAYNLFGLGNVNLNYSLTARSDRLFDFDATAAIADMSIPLLVDIKNASLDMHMDRAAGSTGPIVFTGQLHGNIKLFGLFDATFTSELTDSGGLTVHTTYQSPASLVDPTLVTRHLDLYINLYTSLLLQDIFDPSNVVLPAPPPPAQKIVRLNVDSTTHGPGQVSVVGSAGSLKKTRTLELLEAPDTLRISATGIPTGVTLKVNYAVSTPAGLPLLSRAGADDRSVAASGSFNLTAATASFDLATLLGDTLWELDEQFAIDFTYTVVSGTVDKVISTVDRILYLIDNDDSETAGALVHYDFDHPNASGGYDFTKSPTFLGDPKVSAPALSHTAEKARPNRALNFDGVNDFVRIVPSATLPKTAMTFEFWMGPGAVTSFEHVIALGGANIATVYLTAGSNAINMKFTQFGIDQTIGTFTPEQWQHIAVTFDGVNLRGYVNGVLTSTRPASGAFAYVNNLVYVGTFDEVTDKVFTGMIDEVRIWNTTRTQAQIQQNASKQLTGSEAGLFAYYQFDEGSGVFSSDLTGREQIAMLGPAKTGRDPKWATPAIPSFAYVATPITDSIGLPKIQPSNPKAATSHAAAETDWIASEFSDDLLKNSGNESSSAAQSPSGWTVSKGAWTTPATPDPVAFEGVNTFDATALDSELAQIVDVTGYAAFIDAGAQAFDFRGYVQSLSEANPDPARIIVEYRNKTGTVLSQFDSGPITSIKAWQLIDDRRTAPAGTRSIRVRLIATAGSVNNGSNDAFFDNLSLRAIENDRYFSFAITLQDVNGPLQPDDYRMDITGFRLFGRGDPSGPTKFLVFSSVDNFDAPIASGNIAQGDFDGGIQALTGIGCLRPDQTPIEFRIYGLGATASSAWRIDNLTLLGAVRPRGTCNSPPDANNDSAQVLTGQDTDISVIANDTDPDVDPLTIIGFSNGANGTVTSQPNGVLKYTPAPNFAGTDAFAYTISDGHGGTATATVSITVIGTPLANNDIVSVTEDTTITFGVTGNDTDPLGQGIAIVSNTNPGHGTLVRNANGTFTYTPGANRADNTSFQYTIRDGALRTSTGTVKLELQPVNDAPVANNDSATTKQNITKAINVVANDTDPDGDTLTITSVTSPPAAQGTVIVSADKKTVIFDPATSFLGTSSFNYTISDGHGGSDTATVSVTVAVNRAPVANNDSFNIIALVSSAFLGVLANDTDLDGDPLTITSANMTSGGGSVAIGLGGTNLQYTYGGFRGTATINYVISDGFGGTDPATVTVIVEDFDPTGAAVPAAVALSAPDPVSLQNAIASQASVFASRPIAPPLARPIGARKTIVTAPPRRSAGGIGTIRVIANAPRSPFGNLRASDFLQSSDPLKLKSSPASVFATSTRVK